jgi:hypothetical protein
MRIPLALLKEIIDHPSQENFEYMAYYGNKIIATKLIWHDDTGRGGGH